MRFPVPQWGLVVSGFAPEWTQIVIWSSGIGTLAAVLGITIGIWMYSPSKRYRFDGAPSSIPYRGQKRWHMVLGLFFGLATATWAFSGMLSMDPFPRSTGGPSGGRGGSEIARALRAPAPLNAFARHPREALEMLAGFNVKQLELTSFDGEPVYLATMTGGSTRIVPMTGQPREQFDHQRIIELAIAAIRPNRVTDVQLLNQYDAYYLDRRRERPLPVLRIRLDDEGGSRYYLDPRSARVVGSYNARNWVTRWAYHGLHSLDFPWLYNYRPAWDIVVSAFMLGGTALSVTSLVLAWQVLGRKLKGMANV